MAKHPSEDMNMKTITYPLRKEVVDAENTIAAILTIVPGLGHFYKGYYVAGILWLFLGMPLAIWVGILFGLATGGIGLLFPVACWVALAFDAYNEKDLRARKHHFFPPNLPAPSEDRVRD